MTEPTLEAALAALLGRVAHDIKNPLSVIVANLRFLEAAGDEDQREAAVESSQAADRLTRMIDDLGELELLRSGQRQLVTSEVSLDRLGDELRVLMQPQLGSRRLEIDLPNASIDIDREVLLRALINLLEHGIRQTPARGSVTLSGEPEGAGLRLRVSDGGAPFDPAQQPSFLSAALPARSEPPTGCRSDQGLGLYVAGVAARALGASLAVDQDQDGRVRFTMDLLV